jgi:preprotein translocase subunit SecB
MHFQIVKMYWVESDFKAPNLPLSLRSKVPAVNITVFITILEQNRTERRRTDNTMAKEGTKGEQRSTKHTHKTEDRNTNPTNL